jgi:Outer membrane protein beta-barrel domain
MNTRICASALVSWLLAVSAGASAQAPAAAAPAPAGTFHDAAAGLDISPRNGQSAQQEAADHEACAAWAHGQAGAQPAEYQRAISACLDAHGYSVRAAATSTPPPGAPPPVVVVASGPQLNYHPFEMQIDGGYTFTSGPTDQLLDGGANAGLGFTWFPSSTLPLGVRVDGSYSWFGAKSALLTQAGNFSSGNGHIYGGDVDMQLDLAHRSPRQKLYLLGGVGRYREQLELQQVALAPGFICDWYYCWPGYVPVVTGQRNTTSAWQKSWNAGIGWEIAVAPRTSFFMEARFQSIFPKSGDSRVISQEDLHFLPIRLGLRF